MVGPDTPHIPETSPRQAAAAGQDGRQDHRAADENRKTSAPQTSHPRRAHRLENDGPRHVPPAALDRSVAAVATVALSPLLAVRAAIAKVTTGRVFDHHERLGHFDDPIVIRSFAGNAPGRRLGYLGSLLSGDVRFIGPRPLARDDWEARARRNPAVTPGLLSPGRLRARLGIDYEPEETPKDLHIASKEGLALAARYGVAEVLGGSDLATPDAFTVLDVEIANTSMEEALDWCVDEAHTRPASVLAFVNAACFNEKVENPDYAATVDAADLVLPDGIGLKLAARLQGVSLVANVNGTDLFPRLCERAAEENLSIFLLGARPGIPEAVSATMTDRYPDLQIAGTQHGYFTDEEEDDVIATINASGADILLVAFGVPRQELWIHTHRERLHVGLIQGVGGLFDFYSGRIERAPLWLREIGLEWAWRLLQEPGRMWKRYVMGNPKFMLRAWRDSRKHRHGNSGEADRQLLNYQDVYFQEPPDTPAR